MDGRDVSGFIARSADAVLEYIEAMRYVTDPPLGVSVTGVRRCAVGEGYAVLHLESQLQDASGLMLMVDGDVLDEDEAGFTRYDEISRTIVVRPPDAVLDMLSVSGTKVSVLTDMGFLIRAVADFYRRYGDMLALPERRLEPSKPEYPSGSSPSAEQISAVSCVLSNGMSYVWGAPGTGKTQYILATCIRACLDAGGRVAVFAPTNNSVEQVLSGILKAFEGDGSLCEGIIRLGIPSKGFLEDHPGMCEDRHAQRRVAECMRSVDNLTEVMAERCLDVLEWEVLELRDEAVSRPADADGNVMLKDNPDLLERFRDLLGVFSMVPEARDVAVGAVRRDLRDVMDDLVSILYDRERPAASIEEYDHWSDGDIMSEIMALEREAESLRFRDTRDRIGRARIIASTPQQFISRFRPKGSEEDPRMELDVDWIFLDEAGYCGLVQGLALFTNGVPVTMLGDHMQLPPVSVLDEDVLHTAAERGGRLSDAFPWSMSALHCEGVLSEGVAGLRRRFVRSDNPCFRLTSRRDLTSSHRFGQNLASVLDRYVYRNGMRGSSEGGDLEIVCLDATCDHREGRENRGESEAVRRFLKSERPDPGSVAVLTPYSAQVRLLRRMVGRTYRDCVMTVHASQGREWDTVVFSVADNGVVSRDVPFRFTSSETEVGRRLVNTAVSRAKRRLVLVCDRDHWIQKEGELIGGLLAEVPPDKV